MKNKRTTYLLMAVVAAIWGLIGWKIWKGLQGDDDFNVEPEPVLSAKKKNALSDSFQLILNYRDPFLDKPAAAVPSPPISTNTLPKQTLVTAPKPEPVTANWPEIRYGGLVKRTGQEKSAGFVSVNGSSEIVLPGQKIGEIIITRLWRDSVEVQRGKEKRIVKK
ncbi:MAG: hypothetical protein MUC87_22195 [Bacteroidia bacterium]|jgi:hypothetical protein|nr:hypothetical protein [Bacteroidia bacterium]